MAAQKAHFILLSSVNAYRDAELVELMRLVALASRPVIGLALGPPYVAVSLPVVGAYLATYDYSQPTLAAAARILFAQDK